MIFLTGFQLLHIGLRGVEEHSVHEAVGPKHLHLDDELPLFLVYAANIDNAVAHLWDFRNQLAGEILQIDDLGIRLQR